MRQTECALRKAVVGLVAACSVVGAVFLVWQLVTRDRVGFLSNGHLLGMLALFVLPVWTLAVWEYDRRVAMRSVAAADDEAKPEQAAATPTGAIARHEDRGHAEARPVRHRHQVGLRSGAGR